MLTITHNLTAFGVSAARRIDVGQPIKGGTSRASAWPTNALGRARPSRWTTVLLLSPQETSSCIACRQSNRASPSSTTFALNAMRAELCRD
jgi:hypothetical protein